MKKLAFTLAEVLITLGIIGVVAAMTIPTLITNFQKRSTATRVKTFYSKINQAMQLSIADGNNPTGSVIKRKDYTYQDNLEFLQMFIYPYMKYIEYYPCPDNASTVCTTLYDGGVMSFRIDRNGGDIVYYPKKSVIGVTNNSQRHKFCFQLAKLKGNGDNENQNSLEYVEPYTYNWDGKRESLTTGTFGCLKNGEIQAYCTQLLKENNWKFTGDYPW